MPFGVVSGVGHGMGALDGASQPTTKRGGYMDFAPPLV